MDDLYVLTIKIISNILFVLYLFGLVKILFGIEINKTSIWVLGVGAGAVCFFVNMFTEQVGTGLKSIVSFLLLFIIVRMVLKINVLKCLISIGTFIILLGVANLVANMMLYAAGYPDPLVQDAGIQFIGYLSVNVVTIIALVVLSALKITLKMEEARPRTYFYVVSFVLLSFSMIWVFMVLYEDVAKNISGFVWKMGLAFFVLCLFFFFINSIRMFTYLDTTGKLLTQQMEDNQTLDSLLNDLRRFKHNHANVLSVIHGYIKLKKWDYLEEYMASVIHEVKKKENEEERFSKELVFGTQLYGIYGIILSKMDDAKEKGVAMDIYTDGKLDECHMQSHELLEVLGILIDNAIEAAEESREREVRIEITRKSQVSRFVIENTVKQPLEVHKLFEKNYSTKGPGRGMGLHIVRNILQKYGHACLETAQEESRFRQVLTITPVKEVVC